MEHQTIPIICTVLMIVGNAIIPKLVKVAISSVSNEYSFRTTPVGFTFSIWGLIYTSLLAYSVAILYKTVPWDHERSMLYGVSCVLNCLWIYLYTKKLFVSAAISIGGMIVCLMRIWWMNLYDPSYAVTTRKLVYQNALTTYVGWICGACVINVATTIHSSKEPMNSILSVLIVACIMVVQSIWHVLSYDLKSFRQESVAIPLVGLWTAIGILTNGNPLGTLCGGVLAVICLGILLIK